MKFHAIILFALALAPLSAADDTGALHWTGGKLDEMHKEAAAHLDATGSGMGSLMKEPKANAIIFHRVQNGQAEIHEKLADFVIVRKGGGAILVGGKGLNMKPSAPGEQRGDKVEGGTRYEMKVGDVLYIPAGVVHEVMVEKGKFMDAMVIKAETK